MNNQDIADKIKRLKKLLESKNNSLELRRQDYVEAQDIVEGLEAQINTLEAELKIEANR